MKTTRQRTLLTAVAIAGSVALYGCGGGDSGPDKTPFDQKAVDKAAADAKKKADMEAAAAATAIAEAATASTEAKKAMAAADAAKKAAADAAKYAMTATLDMAKAMAASASASAASVEASAAAKAARAAATKAATAASGHQASMAADASAKAAEKHAMEAAANADAAKRSYGTAQRLTADRNDTADLATAAGVQAQTAKMRAKTAGDEADNAKDQVEIAKAATTKKAAEDARTAAMKARDAAAKAAKEANDAAMAAEAIKSDAAAVAMEKDAASKSATAAMTSSGDAGRYFDQTAGYADARKARDEADAGKKDIEKHADLRMRVPWIDPATTKNALTEIKNAAKAARSAAESLERATNEDVIKARQANIASALATAEAERAKAAGDLTAAWKVHDAARPFSEDGMGVDRDNPASGKTLRHPDGWISVNRNDGRGWAADQEVSKRGPYDVIGAANLNLKFGVTSFGKVYKPQNGTGTRAAYQVNHYNKWNLGTGNTIRGPINTYKYVSYGVWGKAKDGFPLNANNLTINTNATLTETHGFVFADVSNRTMDIPVTGTANYFGNHLNHTSIYAGKKGSNGGDPVIPNHLFGNLSAGQKYDNFQRGIFRATIDFATRKMDITMNGQSDNVMWYDIEGIDLDAGKSTFTGGKYLGIRGNSGSRTNAGTGGRSHDPFKPLAAGEPALVPTMMLHGGVFGPKSDEIAGTIRLSVTVPHKETTNPNLAAAENGWILINTAFAGANQSSAP